MAPAAIVPSVKVTPAEAAVIAAVPVVTSADGRHIDNVLNYLVHCITNAATEGLKCQDPVDHLHLTRLPEPGAFKLAIYFHCGGLDLEPR